MKKRSLKIFFLFISVLIFAGCKSAVDNSVKFTNNADAQITINFRGQAIVVVSGGTTEVKDIPKGTYSYSTTYELPAGAQSSSTQGDVSGSVVIKAGTKILILYSSTYDSNSGTYVLYATMSSSDDQSSGTVTSP